jgi:hypothetical protein
MKKDSNCCFRSQAFDKPYLKMGRVEQSGPVWGVGDALLEAGCVTKPHLPLSAGR